MEYIKLPKEFREVVRLEYFDTDRMIKILGPDHELTPSLEKKIPYFQALLQLIPVDVPKPPAAPKESFRFWIGPEDAPMVTISSANVWHWIITAIFLGIAILILWNIWIRPGARS